MKKFYSILLAVLCLGTYQFTNAQNGTNFLKIIKNFFIFEKFSKLEIVLTVVMLLMIIGGIFCSSYSYN